MGGRMRSGPSERAAGDFAEAAVAHEHPAATRAGLSALRDGGNAVDAAVATAFAACVVMPSCTTIGGCGYMVVSSDNGREARTIEFPPRAPSAATPDMYPLEADDERTAVIGISSVVGERNVHGPSAPGVPAVVAGLCEAQERFGQLSLERVIAPAIELARDGFPIYPELQMHIAEVFSDLVHPDSGLVGSVLADDGSPLSVEQSAPVVQRELAETLEVIARDGAEGFYLGSPGQKIVKAVQERGGILASEDLARTEAIVGRPITLRLSDCTVMAPASPNGGWTELQILGVLARLSSAGSATEDLDLSAFVETSRRCLADRFHFMADPEYVDVPLDRLLGDEYLESVAAEIDADLEAPGRSAFHYPELPWVHFAANGPSAYARDSPHTTHLSTIDADGTAVSCTLTAGDKFGSRFAAAGVILDDAMVWFNAAPGAANSIAPWKRPLANMGPLVVHHDDGRVLAVGAPGGRRIISAVAQVVAHWLRGDDLEWATARPRVDASGHVVLASRRVETDRLDGLRDRGYEVGLVDDRDRFCQEFARPVAVASTVDGNREAAVQPFVAGSVAGL
jgi:gamma-glutamyltranspeptidase / glutathione hydrolase